MRASDKPVCPSCGALDTALAVERHGVRTHYCAACEQDRDEDDNETDKPEPTPNDIPGH
jgi:Zn ribbon nucleic-acid-binding protein